MSTFSINLSLVQLQNLQKWSTILKLQQQPPNSLAAKLSATTIETIPRKMCSCPSNSKS